MNSSIDTSFDLNLIIAQGLQRLKEDMAEYGPVDYSGPYEQKNFYILPANKYGVDHLLRPGRHWAAEVYFSKLLDFILDHERTSGQQYNKGIVFANLGLTQIRNEKFDVGVGHFVAADDEDRPFVDENYTVLNTWLWDPFENELIQYVVHLSAQQNVENEYDAEYIRSFFHSLSVEDRLFLSGSLWSIMKNREHYLRTPNKYTRGRLYSALSDICLLSETLIRKKYRLTNASATEPKRLRVLLDEVVPGVVHNRNNQNKYMAQTPADYSRTLSFLSKLKDKKSRWISCLLLTRNYMAHRFDYLTGLSATDDFFSETYSVAVENSLLALFHLKSIDVI